jgi:hypothetical protein|nr:MAG TPA: HOLLIDAY JUNCTION RESOLVASE, ENZYME, HOMOLOGOUS RECOMBINATION, HOLLIDAY [Caudoviricetes sp.]
MTNAKRKGNAGEVEFCKLIFENLGIDVHRNLQQTRDGGADIKLKPYSIEVKRRAAIGNIYDWMSQATEGCDLSERPIVVCRADRKQWLAVMPIEELFRLIREEVAAAGGK